MSQHQTITNTKILREGIDKGIANSILIKVNQIGTLTETFSAIELAKTHAYTAVVQGRAPRVQAASTRPPSMAAMAKAKATEKPT